MIFWYFGYIKDVSLSYWRGRDQLKVDTFMDIDWIVGVCSGNSSLNLKSTQYYIKILSVNLILKNIDYRL